MGVFWEGVHYGEGLPRGVLWGCGEGARASGEPIGQIAQDFGIAESCVRRWVRKAEQGEGPDTSVVSESGELRVLKCRNLVLEQENEILGRAVALFAWEICPK